MSNASFSLRLIQTLSFRDVCKLRTFRRFYEHLKRPLLDLPEKKEKEMAIEAIERVAAGKWPH